MLSLSPLLRDLTIKTAKLGYQPLDLNYVNTDPSVGDVGDWGWAQRRMVAEIEHQYNDGRPVRVIVLKARQLGISTLSEACLFWWAFLHPGTNGLVLAHENKSSAELFEMTKLYWETFPFRDWFELKYQTKQMLHWLEPLRSRLQVATAKNIQGGRGFTIHALHASEVAFWPDPETLWTGLYQTVPHSHGTIAIIESTANGRGNWFHDMWQQSEEGEVDFKPLFFPWFEHPAYQLQTTLTVKSELSPDERQVMRIGASMENIAWRRWAMRNKVNSELAFMQEFPSTPEEAFVSTGNPLFSHIHLRQCFKPPTTAARGRLVDDRRSPKGVSFVSDPEGPLTIFLAPARSARPDLYFAAVDPTESIDGDAACIQVINRLTCEQVAVWHGHLNPRFIAFELMRIGKFYNECMVTTEIDGGGQVVIDNLVQHYPNIWRHKKPDFAPGQVSRAFGWATTWARKRWAIGLLQSLVIDGSLTIHDRVTYNQMGNFVNDDGYWGDRSRGKGRGDDAVMSLAIAMVCSSTESPVMPNTNPTVYADIYDQEYGDRWDDGSSGPVVAMPGRVRVSNPDGAFGLEPEFT
ncbi:MAG TPA: hypothetical protein VNV87_04540 [Acidimicrobiales bacterium]|nr:hypothetical protein [Acidimicrobiales bacterium]